MMDGEKRPRIDRIDRIDRISSLPDSLLLHILSFLPTKEAVATSFLSKRWRPLRHSLPTLVIFDSRFCRHDFHQFVDDLLISEDLQFLRNFGLSCLHSNVPSTKINTWVNALVNSKVQNLHIWIPFRLNTTLPSSIFNGSTIRVLKLNGITMRDVSTVNLPSLKVLHLNRSRFPDLNCLAIFLSGCPLLELLVLRRLVDVNLRYVIPNYIGKLKHLITADIPPFSMPLMKAFSNVTSLILNETWQAGGDFPTFYNLTHLECVVNNMWTDIVNGLQKFPKLENLVFYELHWFQPRPPIFNVPACISSRLMEFTLVRSCQIPKDQQLEFARFIMENARVLRTVTILTDGFYIPSYEKEIPQILSSYPRASKNCSVLYGKFSPYKEWDRWFSF